MQKQGKFFFCLLGVFVFLFIGNTKVFGQEKVNISAGIGIPELANIALRYQMKQSQLGIGVGTLPDPREKSLVLNSDFFYHFAGQSKLSDRRPWYLKLGAFYLREESDPSINKYIFIAPRLGRDFNLSKKVGVGLDVGFAVQIFDKEIRKSPLNNGLKMDLHNTLWPSLGGNIFYRF